MESIDFSTDEINFVKKLNTKFNQIYWSKDFSKHFGLQDFSCYINQLLEIKKTFNKFIFINVNEPCSFPKQINDSLNKYKLPIYVLNNYNNYDLLCDAETFYYFKH